MKRVMIVLWLLVVAILFIMRFAAFAPLGATDVSTPAGIMQILISIGLLVAALYVILSKKYDGDVQKWAFGVVGTIVGYWLKP